MRMKWWKTRGGEGERVSDLIYNQKKNKFPLYIYEGKLSNHLAIFSAVIHKFNGIHLNSINQVLYHICTSLGSRI